MENKTCSKCGRYLPLTTEYFQRNSYSGDGFRSECKVCSKKHDSQYRKENSDKIKQYYENNKEHILHQKKIYERENKDKIKEYMRGYMRRGYVRKYMQEWRNKNKEKIKEQKRRYQKNNPHLGKHQTQIRRNRLKRLPHSLTIEEWDKAKQHFESECAYCGISEEEHLKEYDQHLHQDHFIPISEGGGYEANNIIPCCIVCNSSKSNKDFYEWYPHHDHYEKEREHKITNYIKRVSTKSSKTNG